MKGLKVLCHIRKYTNSGVQIHIFQRRQEAELKSIEGNEKEIEDRFYKNLEFGTAGLRGVIGNGTNRMNIYTVRRASQGLANFIIKDKWTV